jgi:hypothetical protein
MEVDFGNLSINNCGFQKIIDGFAKVDLLYLIPP